VKIPKKRLKGASKFCRETGVRLVYAQLSVGWIQEAVRWSFGNLPNGVAVVIGNPRSFGTLPDLEWEKTTEN